MAKVSFEKLLSSDNFKFIVGPEKTEFTIHSALVAAQSPALDKLVNGGMKESKERRVVWKDVDVDTFVRFSEYPYSGTYRSPNVTKRQDSTSVKSVRQGHQIRQINNLYKWNKSTETAAIELWKTFLALYRKNGEPELTENLLDDDYTEKLLCHARIYVLAECYGIPSLKTLSLMFLRRVLETLVLYPGIVGDFLKLVRYTYDNTAALNGKQDMLRGLIDLYVACNIEEFWKSANFQRVFEYNAEFSNGVMGQLLKRLD